MRQDHRKGPPSADRLIDCNLLICRIGDTGVWPGLEAEVDSKGLVEFGDK